MSAFSINVPIGSVSFGQTAVAILREIHKRGITAPVFPIGGQVDLSTQKPDPAFQQWLNGCISSSQQRHSRKSPVVRLWHINDSIQSLSDRGNDLITFFELDSLTPTEVNVLRQQRRVYVTSTFTQSIFKQFGIDAVYLPLGFDSFNFSVMSTRPRAVGATSFLLAGKLEMRKGHLQVLKSWAARYGNKKEYRLNCAISNPFMRPEDQNAMIGRALDGKQYWNINFIPWSASNTEYNQVLQSSDIILCCSGGEGRDLPCFHATAMGAWPIAMRAHAYLDYLNDENAVLINPNGKTPARDGMFFQGEGSQFNVGNWFTFDTNDFYTACDEAERRVKSLGINQKGLELQRHSFKDTVDILTANV